MPSTSHRSALPSALLAALSLLLVVAAALADDLPSASPEDFGMSSERLERIGERMRAHLDEDVVAGALGMIARRGKVICTET